MMKRNFTVLILTTILLSVHFQFTASAQSLPYLQGWDSGDLGSWTNQSGNWFVNTSSGNPAPAVEFNAGNSIMNYKDSLMSPVIYASQYEGSLMYLAFDLKLEDINSNGTEKFAVRLYAGDSVYNIWQTKNFGDLNWLNYDMDITEPALGKDFRIGFVAMGEDPANISGWGIDNIVVDLICPAPYDVEAEYVDDAATALITWHSSDTLGPDAVWLHYDDGVNFSGIGYDEPGDFDVAIRFEPSQLEDYEGSYLTQLSFFPKEVQCEYAIRVWLGDSAGTMVVDQPVANPLIGTWNTVTLDNPVFIDASQELWIGYRNNTQNGFPAGIDAGPAVAGYGDMLYDPAEGWISMATELGLNYNWNIQAYVSSGFDKSSVKLISGNNEKITRNGWSRTFIGYNIYYEQNEEDTLKLNSSPVNETFFIHEGISTAYNCYYIEAVYENCTSHFSEKDCLPVILPGFPEHDDVKKDAVRIYPNPASDRINITSSLTMKKVTVYSYTGHKLLEENAEGTKELVVDAGFLEEGLYIIRIETSGGMDTRKVTIIR